jgi:EmrB/QacA subfamily drug resistance transporter
VPGVERKWWTLLGVCLATFMLLVDVTIVNVALPSIQSDLNASLTSLQWVVDAYALTLSALILTAGSLADRLGRRRVFVAGVAMFTLASLACGLAQSATFLNCARAAQGIGGAAMFATSLALIAQEFEGRERGRAIALWGSTVGVAVAIGPLVGGALTEALSWPWIFFVNVPVGVAAVAVGRLRMSEFADPDKGRIDTPGLVCFSVALFLLVFGLLRGNAEGWSSPLIVGCLAGAGILLAVFVGIERRREHPMLDLSLFSRPAFVGVSIGTLAIGAGMFGMFLYLSLYLQNVLDYSPLQAGLRFLPLSALVFFVPLASERASARVPARVLLGGALLIVALGLLLMHGLKDDSSWTALLDGFIVAGLGIGLANPAIGATAIGVVNPVQSGMASGFNNMCRLGGVAIGIALHGAIFQHHVSSELSKRLGHVPNGLAKIVDAGGPREVAHVAPPDMRARLVEASRHAFVSALNEILLVASGILLVGAIASFALIRARDFHAARAAQAAAHAQA